MKFGGSLWFVVCDMTLSHMNQMIIILAYGFIHFHH
jgi:hypothetical protein